MRRGGWRLLTSVMLAGALLGVCIPAAGATAPGKTKSCKLLKPSEITAAFGTEAGRGSQQGADCTWQIGDRTLSLEVVTGDAKASFGSLRDLAQDAGAPVEKVTGVGDRAVFAPIASFKELLVLEGKKFLFLRVLDIANPIDNETAKTALVEVGRKAVRRA